MISLDHLGVIGDSIVELREAWIDAGFHVTTPHELMAVSPDTGELISLGQHSCHIVLESGYIELTAVDRISAAHHLYPWIVRGVSLGILAMGVDDPDALRQRLVESGISAGPIGRATRPIHYGTRHGDALFTWFALGAESTPECLVCFVRNERPELIYQPEVQCHQNGAITLESLLICADNSREIADRYALYSGLAPLGIAADLYRCPLATGSIWVGTAAALRQCFDTAEIHQNSTGIPSSVGFVFSTRGGQQIVKVV